MTVWSTLASARAAAACVDVGLRPAWSVVVTEPLAQVRRRPRATASPSSGRPRSARSSVDDAQGVDHRQGVDALDQVVARRLAELLVGGGEVEDVVDDLEAHPEVVAERGQRVDVGPSTPPTMAPIRQAVAISEAVLPAMEPK